MKTQDIRIVLQARSKTHYIKNRILKILSDGKPHERGYITELIRR